MENLETIKNSGRLLYQYIRGSQLYNTQLDNGTSDIDTGGIFIAPLEDSIGTHIHYKDEIASSKHDDVLYELEKYGRMLGTSNSTVLESLFVPEDKMIIKPHPCLEGFFANKEKFITQRCFKPFTAYAISQIKKCSGLNKAINNPVHERLTPYDFIYTFQNQGSTKLKNWLDNRGLKPQYCGLVNIPNMHDIYGLYYDWGAHIEQEGCFNSDGSIASNHSLFFNTLNEVFHCEYLRDALKSVHPPYGYRGILNSEGTSTELRLSSINDKNDKPLCYISYNESGYRLHCRQYREYKDWEKNRNPARYESNLNKNYDSKNMYHCFRLIQMGIEIARGEGIKLQRTHDREFLLDVRNHKYEYEEIMELAKAKEKEMLEAMANTSIPKDLDLEMINQLTIEAKKSFFNIL